MRKLLLPVVLIVALIAGACGGDDGAEVRELEGEGGTGTATGTGTGTATGTGTDAATGTEAAACEPVGDASTADTTVAVTLQEWAVLPDPGEAPAGTIAFEAENTGEEPHELYVVQADDPADLPTTEDGAFDEEAYGEEKVVGEVHPFPGGESCSGTFDLEPGSYVLLCNIVEEEDGETEAHYQLGMRTSFTVTG